MSPSKEAKLDLNWWIANLSSLGGSPILPMTADWTISSDASKIGWGASWGKTTNRRTVEHSRVKEPYKHPGTKDCFLCPEVIHERSMQQGYLPQDRQLDCGFLPEQQGRHPLSSVAPLDTGDMEVV